MVKIGYARVSTTGQSLDVQLEKLEAVGASKIFQEKLSGSSADRPELQNMIEYIRDGEGDQVVVTKLDRLARSTKDLLTIRDQIEDKGATLQILNINLDTATPTGKMMFTMLGAIATFEREIMLERQADGIAKAKAAGRYKGRKPTATAKTAEVLQMVAEGKTRQAIADQLGIGIASVYRILATAKKA